MKAALSPFQTAGSARHQRVKLGLFFLWLCLVLFMAWHHAFWRDEVRAFSLALKGENIVEMLRNLHGEGHPALWYLLLRAAHFVVRSPVVLPLVSIGVAAAAALLLVLRSPFRWWMIALLLLSNFMLFEYSVVARNYGISALLLFLLAGCYPRYRDRGVLLGVLLALLADTNAHSVLLAGAFLLFWLIDILCEQGVRWTPALRTFLLNAAVSAVGMAACFATIYPTYNDAAMQEGFTLTRLVFSVFVPGAAFTDLVLSAPWEALNVGPPTSLSPVLFLYLQLLISLVMFGSLLGLIRSPGAFIAGLAALIALSLFSFNISWGAYRHEALWLVFLVSMYWITRARNVEAEPCVPVRFKPLAGPVSSIGSALMVLLVALQVPDGVKEIARSAFDYPPLSRARDFGALVAARSDLQDAIIIADPDFLLEALPYYINNRTYLMREQRFDNVSKFTMKARLSIDLGDILLTAKTLRAKSGKPIVILLQQSLDPSQPQIYHEGYNWKLLTTPEQVRGFLTSTRLIARFAPASRDEGFDVYVLD
jgi:hypothetical protein